MYESNTVLATERKDKEQHKKQKQPHRQSLMEKEPVPDAMTEASTV